MKSCITYIIIAFSFAMMIAGCYSERKAARQIIKATSSYPQVVSKHCASTFNPIDATIDSFVYLPGEAEVFTDTMFSSDTFTRIKTVYINKYSYKTDTIYSIRQQQLVNRAREVYLQAENQQLSIKVAKALKERQILLWVAIILSTYTLMRWLLRLWSVRLP